MEKNTNQENGIGIVTAVIIVIIVLILGGIYFYEQRMQKQSQIEALQTQNSTDATALNATASQ